MGIFFSILSPAIFAVNNYIEKFLLEKHNISPVVMTVYSGLFAIIVGVIILFLTGFYPIDTKSLLIILFSGFLTIIYVLPYYKALSLDETSYVIPLFQFYPIFVLALSFIFLNETFSVIQYIGCIIIIFAGFLLSIEELNREIFKLRKSFYYMILSSFLFSGAQVLYKLGVEEIPFWSTLPYEGFGMAIGAICVLLYKKNFSIFINETKSFKKGVFGVLAINDFMYVLARYTGYFALSLMSVGLVSILAGFQSVFVLVFGIILSLWFPYILKEVINKKVLLQKVISIFLMFVGLYLIFS